MNLAVLHTLFQSDDLRAIKSWHFLDSPFGLLLALFRKREILRLMQRNFDGTTQYLTMFQLVMKILPVLASDVERG